MQFQNRLHIILTFLAVTSSHKELMLKKKKVAIKNWKMCKLHQFLEMFC
jgi:hypothetical protein